MRAHSQLLHRQIERGQRCALTRACTRFMGLCLSHVGFLLTIRTAAHVAPFQVGRRDDGGSRA